jgi:hypothetical protein
VAAPWQFGPFSIGKIGLGGKPVVGEVGLEPTKA